MPDHRGWSTSVEARVRGVERVRMSCQCGWFCEEWMPEYGGAERAWKYRDLHLETVKLLVERDA